MIVELPSFVNINVTPWKAYFTHSGQRRVPKSENFCRHLPGNQLRVTNRNQSVSPNLLRVTLIAFVLQCTFNNAINNYIYASNF